MNTPITLSYASWVNANLEIKLLDAFMDKYPNVTVERDQELINSETPGWEGQLIARAAAGTLPDVFAVRFPDHSFLNELGLNLYNFVAVDEEAETIFPAVMDIVSYEDNVFMLPASTTPHYYLVNKRLISERLGADRVPDYDWTLDEFDAIVEDIYSAELDNCAFGARGYATGFINSYPALKTRGFVDELLYGTFDGDEFNFSNSNYSTIVSRQMGVPELLTNKTTTNAQWLEICGTTQLGASFWPEASGEIAIFSQPFYDMSWFPLSYSKMNGTAADGTSIQPFLNDIDIYPYPKISSTTVQGNTMGLGFLAVAPTIDDNKKASAAYELAKWMGYGKEGNLARNEIIGNWKEDVTTEGVLVNPLFYSYWRFPVTNVDEVWATLPHATSTDFALPGLKDPIFIETLRNGVVENLRSLPGQNEGYNAAMTLFNQYKAGTYTGTLADVLKEMEEVANRTIADAKLAAGW